MHATYYVAEEDTIFPSLVVYRLVHAPVISINGARESGVRLPARETIVFSYPLCKKFRSLARCSESVYIMSYVLNTYC